MNFSFMSLVSVASGAVLGALLRYTTNVLCLHWWGHKFPWATLLVNIIGCFIAGTLLALFSRGQIPDNTRLFWMTGFLGALTTFSAFSVESLTLLQSADYIKASSNIAANVIGSLCAVVFGYALTKQIL